MGNLKLQVYNFCFKNGHYMDKTLIQHLTTRYPLEDQCNNNYKTFRVKHEYARICIKYQWLDFLNKLSVSNSEILDTALENVHLQPFIGHFISSSSFVFVAYHLSYTCIIICW